MMRTVVCVAALLAAMSASAQLSQREGGRQGERAQQAISYEVVMFPGPDSLKTRVDIFYRVDRTFFIPVRNQDPALPYPFVRRGEISVDQLGSEGMTLGRSVHRVEIGEMDADPPTGRQWYVGAFSSELPPGPTTVRFQVDDLESKRSYTDGPRKVDVPRFGGSTPATPVFVTRGTDSLSLLPMNYGGDLLFGSPASLLIAWRSSRHDPIDVHYSFTLREAGGSRQVLLADSVLQLRPLTGYVLSVRGDSGRAEYRLTPAPGSDLVLLVVPFAAEKLPLRSYTLTTWLRDGDHHQELPKLFRMVWPDMPVSMKDVDYALAALRYITTPRELDSLMSGGFERERENLERFWQAKDPTPGTAFNEVMTQYYLRVDHAVRTFGTLKQPDGSKTDRGRIYILFGQPGTIDRTLEPSSGREVWNYPRLKKKFTFIDASKTGTYVLVSTDSL